MQPLGCSVLRERVVSRRNLSIRGKVGGWGVLRAPPSVLKLKQHRDETESIRSRQLALTSTMCNQSTRLSYLELVREASVERFFVRARRWCLPWSTPTSSAEAAQSRQAEWRSYGSCRSLRRLHETVHVSLAAPDRFDQLPSWTSGPGSVTSRLPGLASTRPAYSLRGSTSHDGATVVRRVSGGYGSRRLPHRS